MSPLNFDNSLNISATIGTWIGCLFTGVGLIAVVSQIQSFMNRRGSQRVHFIQRAAGQRAPCLSDHLLQDDGMTEQAAPSLAAWFQRRYLNSESTKVTQCQSRMAGTSSWSRLFAQCSILPHHLMMDRGSQAQIYPVGLKSTRVPT